ncbi:nucleotidyl transferase AbiEii/AbiGii toxin family protein [Candidatus Binatia bacterium]|nr:nucleotidyl transferase AbiEii/AbiGii toxin family protein [Candidatus Binatia bacterium]
MTPAGPTDLPVVDVEGLIGLKLQALVNDPRRRRQDEADIVALMRSNLTSLNVPLLERYFALFEQQDELHRFLDEARRQGA